MDCVAVPFFFRVRRTIESLLYGGSAMDNVRIRPIRSQDIPGVLAVYNPYVEHTTVSFELVGLSLDQYARRVESILSCGYPFLVAADASDAVLGFVYLSPFSERGAYRITADLSIYVREGLTHTGLGSLLLDAVIPLAKAIGIASLVSIVTNENTPSIRFHESHGFVKEGELHHITRKFGKDLGVIYYRLAL